MCPGGRSRVQRSLKQIVSHKGNDVIPFGAATGRVHLGKNMVVPLSL